MQQYEKNPELIEKEFNDKLLLFNVNTGLMFELNQVGKLIWLNVKDTFSLEELSGKGKKDKKLTFEVLPLHEILSLHTGKGVATKTNWTIYNQLIEEFENEYEILLNISKEGLAKVCETGLVDLILKNRASKIKVKPGYDGEYGVAEI